jgi:DNA-binding CsgD family transcriptional regulator
MSNRASVPELSLQLQDLAARLRRAETSIATLGALLNAVGPALMIFDRDGRPLFVNRRAAQILARRDGFAMSPAGLATDCVKTTRSLRAAIGYVAARAHSSLAASLTLRFPVARSSPRAPWLVTILPIAVDTTAGAAAGYAALSITEWAARTRIDPVSTADYFLLTPREADVAAWLAAGHSSREAASALHIRIGTVRTHLKSLFEKTGARSQMALALKLQAFAIRD